MEQINEAAQVDTPVPATMALKAVLLLVSFSFAVLKYDFTKMSEIIKASTGDLCPCLFTIFLQHRRPRLQMCRQVSPRGPYVKGWLAIAKLKLFISIF